MGDQMLSADRLVAAARAGDQDAWDALVDRHAQEVWASARSHGLSDRETTDVSLLTWLRLADHLGDLRADEEVGPWLCSVAHDEARAVARERATHSTGTVALLG